MPHLPFGDPFAEDKELSDNFNRLVEKLVFIGITLDEAMEEIEKLYIEMTLRSYSGNRSKTARKLGMHRNTLNAKMEKYKINGGDGRQ